MRRIALALLGALLFTTMAMAQVTDFSQRGVAQELNAAGLNIAHASLPLNSRAKVVNILTGKEVEVTVTGRIPVSPNRIADLSPEVWQELGLESGAEVRIYTTAAPRPRPALPVAIPEPVPAEPVAAEPVPVAAEPPAPKEDVLPIPLNITVNLTTIEAREAPKPAEPLPEAAPEPEEPEAEPEEPVQPQEAIRPAPTYPVQPTVAAAEVLLIPGLPDPVADKVYRLQVGAFSAQEAADRTARLVASLGFHVVWEQSGTLFRVFAVDVPAVLIQSAAQRLGLAGIREVWVRE